MTPEEANDIYPILQSIRRYVDDQPVSYPKKQALDGLYTLMQACQETLAEEWKK